MILWILRGIFLLASVGIGFAVISAPAPSFTYPWLVFVLIVTGSVAMIVIDAITPRKRIDVISCVYFGILIGLFLSWVVITNCCAFKWLSTVLNTISFASPSEKESFI